MESRLPREVVDTITGFVPRDSERSTPTGVIIREAIEQIKKEVIRESFLQVLSDNPEFIKVEDFTPGTYRVRVEIDMVVPVGGDT